MYKSDHSKCDSCGSKTNLFKYSDLTTYCKTCLKEIQAKHRLENYVRFKARSKYNRSK